MATMAQWVQAARPRTLPAAVAPVLVGTGSAISLGARHPGRALAALGVSLALQIGVNYANDYSDGIRGTDADRVGPLRLTGSSLARPAAVKKAAFACFGLAAVIGLGLVAVSGTWWLIAVGAAAIAAAWFYTGGQRPYGYAGLGEVFVFTFFGLVAVLGTTYTQAGRVDGGSWAGAVGVGVLACAILVANNLRDVPTDALANKHTLAVRLGEAHTRTFYCALIVAAYLVLAVPVTTGHPWAAAAGLSAIAAWPPVETVRSQARGMALIPVLRQTGRLELLYGVLLAVGLAL